MELPDNAHYTERLRAVGCPYPFGAPEVAIWLQGYKAGVNWAFDRVDEWYKQGEADDGAG